MTRPSEDPRPRPEGAPTDQAPAGDPPPAPAVPDQRRPPAEPPHPAAQPDQAQPVQGQPAYDQPVQAQPYPGYPPPWAPPPAPKPGVIPLRPLGVGEVLDGAISYIRANPKVTLGLAALLATVSQLIQVPATAAALGELGAASATPGSGVDELSRMTEATAPGLIAFALGMLVTFVTGTVLTGMLIVVVSRAVVGRSPSLGEVWAVARPRLLGLVGLSMLTALVAVLLVALGVVPLAVAIGLSGPGWVVALLAVTAFALVVVALVYLWVAWSLAAPAYVLERLGVVAALRRSASLVRAHWWRIFGILLLGALIAMVLGGILSVPFSLAGTVVIGLGTKTLGAPGAGTGLLPILGMSITAIGAILSTTLTAPFSSGISGLLYFDQRIRREGWDIELARSAQAPAPPAPAFPEQAIPQQAIPEQAGPPEASARPDRNPTSPG